MSVMDINGSPLLNCVNMAYYTNFAENWQELLLLSFHIFFTLIYFAQITYKLL